MPLTNEEILGQYLENQVQEAIQRAFLTDDLSTGGALNAEQSDRFLDLAIDESRLLSQVRDVRMMADKRKIEKIGFASRVLRGATQGEAPATTSKPTTSMVELSTNELIAAVDLGYSTIEDNIERGNLENTVMERLARRVGADLEEFALQGDTVAHAGDDLLEVDDGWITKVTSNVVTILAAPFTEDSVFGELLTIMPSKFFKDEDKWKFYVSKNTELAVRRLRAARATAGGDRWLESNVPLEYGAVAIERLPFIEDDEVLLAAPENLIQGMQRQITVETERVPRKRIVEITLTLRADYEYEEEEAVAYASGFTLP